MVEVITVRETITEIGLPDRHWLGKLIAFPKVVVESLWVESIGMEFPALRKTCRRIRGRIGEPNA
jgi:hypothetical protein